MGDVREAGAAYVRYCLDVSTAFGRCNEKMAALRAWAAHVRENGARGQKP